MIMKFVDCCNKMGPFGIIPFIFIGTFMCCTGLMFVVLLIDWMNAGND